MPEFSVVFYNRDFSGRLSVRDVKVDRYSWNMIGGPEQAFLNSAAVTDGNEMMKLLRCPVEIYSGDGPVWWGYVNRVIVPYGDQMVGIGLDELYNYIIVDYSGGATAAGSDATSITEYGQKEYKISASEATQTEGEASRDLYLAQHKYAPAEFEFSGARELVSIECAGWYSTLGWKYYADVDTTNTENTTQIENIVSSAGQFLRGTIIEDIAGILSNENRDGNRSALSCVNELLNAGTTNTRPLLAYVDKDRYLHVYERKAEPPTTNIEYLYRGDGKLVTPLGQVEPDNKCVVAAWAKLKDVPDVLGGFSAVRPFFIESAEYSADNDKTTYRPAGAFEQIRLAKYISSVVSGGGVGDYTLPSGWSFPTTPTSYSTMRYMMVAGIAANRAGVGNTDQTWVVPVTASSGAIGTITTNYIAIYVTGYYAIIARAGAWAASSGSGDFNISWFTAASRGGSFISDYGDYIDDINANNLGTMCIFKQITAGTHIYSNLEKVTGTGSIQGGTFETLILKLG